MVDISSCASLDALHASVNIQRRLSSSQIVEIWNHLSTSTAVVGSRLLSYYAIDE